MINKLIKNTVNDIIFWKFIIVGIVNTLFGTAIMFVLYNYLLKNFYFELFGLTIDGYWLSTAANYIFGSILSYFLNKYFTFQYKERNSKVVIRFVINIVLCYILAYGIAKPAVRLLLKDSGKVIQDNVAMFTGMVLFVGLNYIGQRFFAFKTTDTEQKNRKEEINENFNIKGN